MELNQDKNYSFKITNIFENVFSILFVILSILTLFMTDFNKVHEVVFALFFIPIILYICSKSAYKSSFVFYIYSNSILVKSNFLLSFKKSYEFKNIKKIQIRNNRIVLCYDDNIFLEINVINTKKQKIINHLKANICNYDDLVSRDIYNYKFNWVEFIISLIGLIFLLILKIYFIEDTIKNRNSYEYKNSIQKSVH